MTEHPVRETDLPVVIVGAGRQGRIVTETLAETTATDRLAGFLDDTRTPGEIVLGLPVLGGFARAGDTSFIERHRWIVAIGDNLDRQAVCRMLEQAGAVFASAIDPTAKISPSATFGNGLFIGPFARVATGARIGDWSIVEAHTVVGADTHVGTAAFVGPGAQLLGSSSLGARSFLGANAVISNKVAVGCDCSIGANSLVLRPLADGTAACGTPARPARLNQRPLKFRRHT